VGDYLDKLGANRADGLEHAATAKSHRKLRRKGTSLTTTPKRAKLRVKRVATKPPGKETRGTTKKTPSEKAKMAKKSKRSKKRRSAAQQAATRKMLRAAKAKRAGKSRRGSSKRKARKSGKRKSAKRVAAGKKAARTRKRRASVGASEPTKRKRSKRKSGKRRARKVRAAHSIKLPRGKRGAKKRVGVHVKVGKKRRSRGFSVPRKTKRVYVIAAEKSRRRRKRKAKANPAKRRRHSSGRRKGTMENPMDGVELFIGAITGLAGFLTADVLDRFLATHPLTVSTAASGSTAATYTDTPPTSGDYQGLFNATAICAPMDATRWLAGLGVATVPLVIAHFISAPKGRAALQFFGYAAGIRVVGKGLIDMIAQLTQPTQLGQQLYDGEMRAAALKAGNGTIASGVNLPSSGLGRARLGTGKPCAPCATKKMGAGYPSAPREVTAVTNNSTPTTQNQPTSTPTNTAPTASTPVATPPAPPAAANTLTGARFINGLPRRNPNWGYQGDE
jgi:DNA-binding protein HU-beta